MNGTALLKGGSRAFTVQFRKTIEDCGLSVTAAGAEEPIPQRHFDLIVFEVKRKKDLAGLALPSRPRPFIVFTGLDMKAADTAPLREKGLIGAVSAQTPAEDVAFLVNKAVFYDRVIKRNPRAMVSLPVTMTAGARKLKANASMLSRDGMFVVTLNPLPVDANFDIEFRLPDEAAAFRTKARVLYTIEINKDLSIIANPSDPFKRLITHPGMAVYFTDLPGNERDAIDAYIKKLS